MSKTIPIAYFNKLLNLIYSHLQVCMKVTRVTIISQRILFYSCVDAFHLALLGIMVCLEELVPGPETSNEIKFSHNSHTSIDGPKKGRIRAVEGVCSMYTCNNQNTRTNIAKQPKYVYKYSKTKYEYRYTQCHI